ncbi:hypothetical protein Nepgr_030318 [Nepenthes gracilis]|uniref:Uncharacterized protein n=1 Tax=Nepenthes gracilis TaxID=150966 RepID=A0AAD3TEF8_NEPGR|nr:hypothetical protein Nepgr_030318 [Nepenthes gracilis]
MPGASHLTMAQSSCLNGGMRNESDIIEEILSVAQASQDLIYQSDEAAGMNAYAHYYPISYDTASWEATTTRFIEIGDANECKSERMVDYSDLVVFPADRNHELVRVRTNQPKY